MKTALKVLIITYYWPPAGGSGVQRWLKFVKYLRDFGIEPIVFTVDNPNYALQDFSLEKDVHSDLEILRVPIWEPNNLLSFFKKQKQTSAGFINPNPNFIEKILLNIRANLFVPDARKYWIKPSVAYLKKYLTEHQVDVVISSGPPHSLHLIGLQLKKELGIKWLADFRDPWTEIDYFDQLPLNKKAREKHFKLEQDVLQHSDGVLVVGKTMKDSYSKWNSNIHVITNGFDGEIANVSKPRKKAQFSITHLGLMNADRNPKVLWHVLAELCKEYKGFNELLSIELIGKVDAVVLQCLDQAGLAKHLNLIDYLPHDKVAQKQQTSQVLLLVVNNVPFKKGIVTGKVFEYLQAQRPILAIGPTDGDLAEIINETNSGSLFDYEDAQNLKKQILDWFNQFKNDSLTIDSENVSKYHRKALTKQLAQVINSI